MKKLIVIASLFSAGFFAHADDASTPPPPPAAPAVDTAQKKLSDDRAVRKEDQKRVNADRKALQADKASGAGPDQLAKDRSQLKQDRKARNEAGVANLPYRSRSTARQPQRPRYPAASYP